jgi:hypothetical protein
VSGVPPSLNELLFMDVLLHSMPQIIIFNQVRVPQNFFKDLMGAVNQKKVENHWSSYYNV